MGFKNYFIASVILLAAIAGYVFTLNLGEYTLNLDLNLYVDNIQFEQTLPIYIWVIIPATILFIATNLHMSYYGSKGFFEKKSTKSDIYTINDYIEKRLLNEKSNKKLKTNEFKDLGNILNQLDLNISNEDFVSENETFTTIVNKINDINNGKYISIKSLHLKDDNPIVKQNLINRIKNDDNFAYEILKNSSKYNEDIIKLAFDLVLENKSIDKIKNIINDITMTNEMVASLLLKDSKLNAEQRFTNSEILNLIQNNKLSNNELISIAKNYKRTMQPEQLIKLFEDISANDESLTPAYLYVLFQYEMLTQMKEILDNSQKDEYPTFKALLDLKDAGKHYSVENLLLF